MTKPANDTESFNRLSALVYLLCGVLTIYLTSLILIPTVLFEHDDPSSWLKAVNLRNNSYHMWRSDWLSSTTATLLSKFATSVTLPTISPACIHGLILLLGTIVTCLSLRPHRRAPHPSVGLLASFPVLLAVYTVGWDPIILGTLAWVPLLACALSALMRGPSQISTLKGVGPLWCTAALLSIGNAIAGNHVAPVSAAYALILAYILAAPEKPCEQLSYVPYPHERSLATPPSSKLPMLLAGVALAPALVFALLWAPEAPIPDYPSLAHVVPDDGLDGVIQPLVGRAYPLHVLDRGAVKSTLYLPAILLCSISGLAWLLMRKRLQRKGLMAILATSTLAGAVLLDTALAERYAALAPLQSLSRLIPWATTFCMTSITLAAAFWLLGVYLLSNHAPKTSAALITATLALLGFWQWRDYDEQLRDYRALSNPSLRSVAVSPSAATLIHHIHATATDPAQTLANIATLDDATWQKVSRVTASVETSLDGAPADQGAEPSTRKLFPIKFTRSLGSEFISVSFSTPITTQGLRIKLGKHTSDFAPGLLIQNGPCSAPLQTLINAPDWQGAISLTPSGYPYFLGQDDIRIIFANPISTSALCLRNTRSSNFDWYVGRIDLMSTSPSPDTSDVEPG